VNSKFNGGGHINHSLFWANLAPANSSESKLESASNLRKAIDSKYGSFEKFQEEFKGTLLGLQGSGYVFSSSEYLKLF
jgi:superoxide dismutase, Fe-Mn family